MGKWAMGGGDRLEQSWELQSPSGPISAVVFVWVVLEMLDLAARALGWLQMARKARGGNAAKSLTKTKAAVFGAANEQL